MPHRIARTGVATAAVLALAAALPPAGAATSPTDGASPASPASPASAASAARTAAPRPNLVFILADDLGWADLHTGLVNDGHGSDFNDTPAIDRLAQEGMVFDNAYACLNCAPTRMELLSGLYPTHPENNVYIVGSLTQGGPGTPLVGVPQGREDGADALSDDTVTVGSTLQASGYRTGYIGKFQVTRTGADVVAHHGFDENLGGTDTGAPSSYFASGGQFDDAIGPELDRFAGDYTQDYVDTDIAPYSTGVTQAQLDALVGTHKHLSDAVADATLDFIDRNDDQPFLAWMSTYAVHAPVGDRQARRDLLAKYQARTPGNDPSRASYAALVESVDQSVARVIDHLETTPDPRNPGHALADNTLVVFTSDNGGRTFYGANNGPLRGQKGELLEGGVRVPWIAWSENPALVRGGTVNHSVIDATDLYPTLASYAGAPLPAGVPFDGVDLRNAVRRGRTVSGPTFAHLPGYHAAEAAIDQTPESTVRDGDDKLTYTYEDQSLHLYDLAADIGETTDIAAANPAVVARLGTELATWLASTDAPLATLREGRAPLTVSVPRGIVYADGAITRYRRPTSLVIQPGQEVPLVVPSR